MRSVLLLLAALACMAPTCDAQPCGDSGDCPTVNGVAQTCEDGARVPLDGEPPKPI